MTGHLRKWDDVKEGHDWKALLLGNGSSQAIWSNFGYDSLFEKAPLTPSHKKVFAAARTQNFELVLDNLKTSQTVCRALGHRASDVEAMYQSIQAALATAVADVHIPWSRVPDRTLTRLERELRKYTAIYMTNYDLLTYWAIMSQPSPSIGDFFWNGSLTFDANDTDPWGCSAVIHYLHGGLHLRLNTATGVTSKRRAMSGGLLNLVHCFIHPHTAPDYRRTVRRQDALDPQVRLPLIHL